VTYDVAALRREEFPWADGTVYLDHASVGPMPERTRRAADDMNRRRSRPFELGHEHVLGALAAARTALAGLIHADPAEIALATNTSFGLGMAARALPFQSGDIVLVSHREFPANVYPWMRLGDRGVQLELVPVTPDGWPDEGRILERLGDPRVRCLAVSLTQFASGYTVDLDRFSAETRARGQFLVVDAIQALGQLPSTCGARRWTCSPAADRSGCSPPGGAGSFTCVAR
jgi:selenocysteine lyase/cysteine desulfurase